MKAVAEMVSILRFLLSFFEFATRTPILMGTFGTFIVCQNRHCRFSRQMHRVCRAEGEEGLRSVTPGRRMEKHVTSHLHHRFVNVKKKKSQAFIQINIPEEELGSLADIAHENVRTTFETKT